MTRTKKPVISGAELFGRYWLAISVVIGMLYGILAYPSFDGSPVQYLQLPELYRQLLAQAQVKVVLTALGIVVQGIVVGLIAIHIGRNSQHQKK